MDHQTLSALAEMASEAEPRHALDIADGLLAQEPGLLAAHFLMADTAMRNELKGLAGAHYRQVAKISPTMGAPWNNLGKIAQGFQNYDEAAECLARAIALDTRDAAESIYNLATVRLQQGRPEDALDLCAKALSLKPELDTLARETSALGHLALGHWRQGWLDYDAALDGDYRLRKTYHGNVEPWSGPENSNRAESFSSKPELLPLIVHTEQGIGDEIIFASMLDDLNGLPLDITLDCDPRNAGLFKRSFPHLKVFGTRRDIAPYWLEDKRYAVAAIGSLGKFYRTTEESFPGKPYLTACPARSFQWRQLLRSTELRPIIGLAWNGGRQSTGQAIKSASLETFAPLFAAFPDALYVSLEYRDRSEEIERARHAFGIEVGDFPWVTLSQDYDDTAALVSACDVVVSVMTSVAHLASALGVSTHMMLPTKPQPIWRYYRRDKHPVWYRAMTLHRQTREGDWAAPLASIIASLKGTA